MATYTVNITGTLDSSYGYATINGTKITTTGTSTYTSRPTISVYVGSGTSQIQASCRVYLNNGTVQSGAGTYKLTIDATTVDIVFTAVSSKGRTHYTADITTSGGPESGGGSGGEHYTNIGNVAREIDGGTALIGGVLREIESGMVLAGGVVKEILFGPQMFTVEISGSIGSDRAWVEINGRQYNNARSLVVEGGTELIAYAKLSTTAVYKTNVYLNGSIVLISSSVSSYDTFTHVIKSNIEVELDDGNTINVYITEK